MPEVGDTLDSYRLDAVIGRGGMGTVYRATDLALEKTVAVKVIAPHLASDDAFVARFREEAKALARLDATGIVGIHAMRETDAAMFLVMEYVEGPSLETVLQRNGALPPDEAVSLTRQILQAVQHAHDADVLHRDLKPSNILIASDELATITDFGLAKIVTSDSKLTSTHQRMGTVAYMSPEQVRGLHNVNAASDLFSVGLITYEMLAGRLPYDASASEYAIQRAIVEEPFPPPSTYASGIPPWLDAFVMQLIAKDPGKRPRSAREALSQLPGPEDGDFDSFSLSLNGAGSDAMSLSQWGALAAAGVLLLAIAFLGVRSALQMPSVSSASDAAPLSTLSVMTEPDGAAVFINGDSLGRTPLRAAMVPSGSLGVRLSKAGHRSVDTTVVVQSTERLTASLVALPPPPDTSAVLAENTTDPAPETAGLPPSSSATADDVVRTGVVSIRSRPSEASVTVNDRSVGLTPITVDGIEVGAQQITLRRNDHRPFQTTVQVVAGDTVVVAPSLVPRPAVVTLRAIPAGDVVINGEERARDASTAVVDSLMPGTHDLALVSNLGRWEKTVQLDPGERYQHVVDFSKTINVAVMARAPDGTPIPNAVVQVGDSTAGYTPQRLSLHVGQHTIRVSKAGYAPLTRTLMMETSREEPLVFELTASEEGS
jgi:serine/threonine protein kinase